MIISPAPTNTATVYNTITGESRTVPTVQADHMARNSRGEWSYAKPLPPGWNKEVPRYRASISLRPSPKARHRLETPFSSIQENEIWQYGERPIAAGETIETTSWPHATMTPLNDSAKAVREFFTSRQKSRLPLKAMAERPPVPQRRTFRRAAVRERFAAAHAIAGHAAAARSRRVGAAHEHSGAALLPAGHRLCRAGPGGS